MGTRGKNKQPALSVGKRKLPYLRLLQPCIRLVKN